MCACASHSCSTHTTVRDVLMDEHRVIERVLNALERMLADGVIDREFTIKALDFFRNFADRCHHHKEEERLFPAMELAGTPREGGPIGCMLYDHEVGRELLWVVAQKLDPAASGNAEAGRALQAAAAQYVSMLRAHIQKEDNILFVHAEQILSHDTKRALLAAFEHSEHSAEGGAQHARYLRLADELEQWSFRPAAT